ncbi:MAG: methyltransferase [Acidimicrobiia bacterium]
MIDCYERTTCRMCEGPNLSTVLSLTPTPPGNRFLTRAQLGETEPRYPLDLVLCRRCGHVQLKHVVDPRILYQNSYSYVSGTSPVFVRHLDDYAAHVIERFGLPQGALVVDIGSNDGTALRAFQARGMRVLGVDPAANIAERATATGIPTVSAFFGSELAKALRQEHGPAAFVTSHNACAHIDQLDDVFRGVATLLAPDGVFGCEVGYLLDVVQNLWFDTIYHEHLDYHTAGPFEFLYDRCGLMPIGVDRVAPQGGSLRLFAQPKGVPRSQDGSFAALKAIESEAGLAEPATFEAMGARIRATGNELRRVIEEFRAQGRAVAAFGAPTKATTLTAHFGLDRHHLDFIVDDNPLKCGLYAPLTHVPVLPASALYERRPDVVLILAWNFADSIMRAHQAFLDSGGRFVVPMPDVRVFA